MRDTGKIANRVSSFLPRLGLSALILCLASGVVLLFYYRPTGNVFQNVEEITTLVPFGWFFRQLHYGAGQAFAILMLVHFLEHFLKKRYRVYRFREWSFLILSLGLCFFVLFTGFVLKADKEGIFAGRIFMNIIRSIPLAGDGISRLFIRPGEGFFFLPYLYHCFFLPLLLVYLIKDHIREWFPSPCFMIGGTIALFLYALLVRPAPAIPPGVPVELVRGPWFFLGLQALLKTLPPLLAGVVIPLLFLGCLLILSVMRSPRHESNLISLGGAGLHYLLVTALCLYCFLCLRAGIRGP